MNILCKTNLLASLVQKATARTMIRPITMSTKILSDKKPVNEGLTRMPNGWNDFGTKQTMEEEISTIHKNEDAYYGAVKSSFDNVQTGRKNESVQEKRARLIYQSRKRGTTENGLLLAHFSQEFVPAMTETELDEYNLIINSLANEWDLYYWLTNARPLPDDLQNSGVMKKMIDFCANAENKERLVMPTLPNL